MNCSRCGEYITKNSANHKYCSSCAQNVAREKNLLASRRYARKYPERRRESVRKSQMKNKPKYYENIKNQFINLVGLKCELCGIEGSSLSLFDIHFPNNEHPRKPSGRKIKNVSLYFWIIKRLPKKTWMFLCPNCHRLQHYEGEYSPSSGTMNHGIIMASDVETVLLDDSWDVYGKVYEALAPIIFRSNSIAFVDAISGVD